MNHRAVLAGLWLAVAGVPAHAQAENDVVLSGTFAASLSQFDSDVRPSDFDLENNASRVGLFASTQQKRLKAFLNYERSLSNDGEEESVREFYAGLSGSFGTASAGRKSTDYKLAGVRVDPFHNTSLAGSGGHFSSTGASYGLSPLTDDVFTDNTVAYASPSYMGLTGNVAVFVNDNNDEQDDDHSFAAGLNYAHAKLGLTAALQFLSVGEADLAGPLPEAGVAGFPASSGEAVRVSATYAWRNLAFGLSAEQLDVDDESEERRYGFLSATYKPVRKMTLAAAFGIVRDTESAVLQGRPAFDGDGVSLGVFYEVVKNFNVYGGGRLVSLDSANDDTTTFAAGFAYSFDVDLE